MNKERKVDISRYVFKTNRNQINVFSKPCFSPAWGVDRRTARATSTGNYLLSSNKSSWHWHLHFFLFILFFFFIFLSENVKSCQNVVMNDIPCHNCRNTAKVVKMLRIDKNVKIPTSLFIAKALWKCCQCYRKSCQICQSKVNSLENIYYLLLAKRGYHSNCLFMFTSFYFLKSRDRCLQKKFS